MLSKFVRKSRRHRQRGDDGKSDALMDAGLRLLARKDYEAISMAELAREAGCSVGALYARYSDKNAYLYRLIGTTFRTLTTDAQRVLGAGRWRKDSASLVARQIVGHAVTKMTTPRAAGVIRATVKLATVKPATGELFEDYREVVTNLAIDVLTPKVRDVPPSTIRIAMQIVLGTITDAVLQKHPGAMNVGNARMTDALINVLAGYLGLSKGGSWAGAEADGEDASGDSADLGSETPPELADGEIAVFDPDLRTYRGKVVGSRVKRRKPSFPADSKKVPSQIQPPSTSAQPGPAKPASRSVATPPSHPPTPPPEIPTKPLRKVKHRLI